jgi:regulator of protease activity HflC (stomatin/prohibitin superfamily)
MTLRTNVSAYHKALVFKNNRYIKLLEEGKHWVMPGEQIISYDMTKPFTTSSDLNILLQEPALAEALQIVDVKQNELALLYENGLFKSVLTAGRYAYWKGIITYTTKIIDLNNYEMTEPIDKALLVKPEISAYIRAYTVESYEQGLLYVDGKFSKRLEPGIHYFWRNPIALTVYKSDTRQLQMEMNGQEILTKDKANIRLNVSLMYKVADIFKTIENKEYDKQLYVLLQLALREQVAAYTLDELLDKRDTITPLVLAAVKDKATSLGVTVTDCGIRDIVLPGDMKEIMNQVLVAEKKAQANSIMRREETASTRSLLNTARLMEENEMLFKLKEMEYVEKIADKISSISVSGGGDLVGQLKQIFIPQKKG